MSFYEEAGDSEFDINATEERDGIKYYINMYPLEGQSHQVLIMIDPERMEDFRLDLQEAANTFSRWDSISVVNDVVDLEKTMSTTTNKLDAVFQYGDWNFDFNVTLQYRFKHIDEEPTLIIGTGELQSSSNQYIDNDGGMFVFTSRQEVDDFIEGLDPSLARAFFDSKGKKEDLFDD